MKLCVVCLSFISPRGAARGRAARRHRRRALPGHLPLLFQDTITVSICLPGRLADNILLLLLL